MKAGRLQEATAALFLTSALINGAVTHHYDEEASKAKGIEQTYIAQGNQQQAAEWAAYSDNEGRDKDIYLSLTITGLGLAATFGALGASSVSNRRREEEQPAQPTQPTLDS